MIQVARGKAFTETQVKSPLASKAYDLRHAGISLRLNSGVPPTHIAEWAGQSVEILLRVYAHCLDGDDDHWFARMDNALGR